MGCRLNRIWLLWANGVGALGMWATLKVVHISIATPLLSIARIKHGLCLGCFVTAVQGWGVLGGVRGGVAQNLQGYRGLQGAAPTRHKAAAALRQRRGGPLLQWVSMSLGTVLFSPKASCHQQGAFALLDTPPDGNHGDYQQPPNSQRITRRRNKKSR